jgi:hypothetical protein
MKRTKLVAILMAASMLASCGKVPAEETTEETAKEVTEETTEEEATDEEEETVSSAPADSVTDISEFSSLTPGSLFIFGEYEGEPIEWIVLENEADEIYCLSRDIVSQQPYESDGNVLLWNDSTLCYWLNSTFFEEAFTDEEKVRIERASDTIAPEVSSDYRIYLLNRLDFSTYRDIFEQYPVGQYWWLRSRGDNATGVADCCNTSGELCFDCLSCLAGSGVRPVMTIYIGDDEDRLDPEALIPLPEPTPVPTPTSRPTPSPTPTPIPDDRSYFDGIVTTEYTDLGTSYRFPHINIDTDEINALNQKIKDDVFVAWDGSVWDHPAYTRLNFSVYHCFDGIYSVVIDYNDEGWDGHYTAYTFNTDGHILTSDEVLSLAGLTADGFYTAAADATQTYINTRYTGDDGVAPVIDHAPNPEWGEYNQYADFLVEDFSTDSINVNMTMFFDNEGHFIIVQPIMAIADGHDCEPFIAVPSGERITILIGAD